MPLGNGGNNGKYELFCARVAVSGALVKFHCLKRSISFTNAILFVECQSIDTDRRQLQIANAKCQCARLDVSHTTHLLNVFKMVFRFHTAFATVYYIPTTDSTHRTLFLWLCISCAFAPLACLHCHRRKHSNGWQLNAYYTNLSIGDVAAFESDTHRIRQHCRLNEWQRPTTIS